jgi:acetyl-CoA C-acetyltransferase
MHQDGFFCPMAKMLMGATVEQFLAKELQISRQEQDAYALESHLRAASAWKNGLFDDEVVPFPAEGKFPGIKSDEHVRADTTLEKLSKLPAVFDLKTGSVTAGNSSGITDGAAWMHVGTEKSQLAYAEVLDYEIVALDPKRMGLGPVPSIQNLLKRQKLSVSDLTAIEINEAFAAQVIACQRELKIAEDKLNARGGAIALGHPIGATGARILVTLLHRLKKSPGALGLASLCVSGGQGVSILIKSLR